MILLMQRIKENPATVAPPKGAKKPTGKEEKKEEKTSKKSDDIANLTNNPTKVTTKKKIDTFEKTVPMLAAMKEIETSLGGVVKAPNMPESQERWFLFDEILESYLEPPTRRFLPSRRVIQRLVRRAVKIQKKGITGFGDD